MRASGFGIFSAAMLVWLALASADRAGAGAGALPEGERTITLVAADGTRLDIGRVTFTAAGEGRSISVVLDTPALKDEFLSMRPFRCLPDAKEMWCHLAYPYASAGMITADDLTDLEYRLLFLFKPPTAYGIDAWNGLYFRLALGGAGIITGTLHETDLNVLAVPPAEGEMRPITPAALTATAEDAHRFARVEIK